MPDPVWYRSLYWRIALGFVALVATLLVVQGLVFLWMTGRMSEFFPSRSPAQFASSLASDVAVTLAEAPDADLNEFVTRNYARAYRAFAIVLQDGRYAVSKRVAPPGSMVERVSMRAGVPMFRGVPRPPGAAGAPGGPPRFGPPPDPAAGPPAAPRRGGRGAGGRGGDVGGRGGGDGRGGDGFRGGDRRGPPTIEFAPIVLNGAQIGMVGVPLDPPPLSQAMRDIGPTLAVVALGLLLTGTAVAALVVFRPAKRRLHDLQQAAQAIGAGASGVRARESGGDEVSSLARAFNEMAARLEERSSALEDADRTRRRLLADVSHELSTPLAAIRGYVETLGMANLALPVETRDRYLQIITEETERLEHIVGDLLDLAKLEGGGAAFRMEPVTIAHLVERVERRHTPALERKRITLDTAVAPGAETCLGDANRLEQALQNLVANATRHTPEGGRIVVRADRDGAGLRLTVEDTGPGIPEEHLPHVFDRFYKVDVSRAGTALPSGSGLGLSIVQAIVQRHGGTVTASNRPEGGARFEIRLPDLAGQGLA